MTNEQYKSLWDTDNSRTFMVLRANDEQEYGNIVVGFGVDETTLLQQGKNNGIYPQDSFLVEIVDDFDGLDNVDIN